MVSYKELFITYSLSEKNKIVSILEENDVPFKLSVGGNSRKNILSGLIAVERFGEKVELSCEYKISVMSDDYDKARHLIGN